MGFYGKFTGFLRVIYGFLRVGELLLAANPGFFAGNLVIRGRASENQVFKLQPANFQVRACLGIIEVLGPVGWGLSPLSVCPYPEPCARTGGP